MTVPTLKPVALSQGDPAGIGPDIALMAWLLRDEHKIPPFLYIGDRQVLADRARLLGFDVPLIPSDAAEAASIFARGLPVFDTPAGGDVAAGIASSATASGTIMAIERAVDLCFADDVLAMATNPIAKSVLYDAGFQFPGHTEFLADLAARRTGKSVLPVMLLSGPKLKAIPVTIHIPLNTVSSVLTEALIVETCRITDQDLKTRFGIAQPRLAVAGLNPHAGEGGALGKEDDAVIAPAIARLQAEGINAFGPLPADTMFHEAARERYDVAICMYHDQALIPAKALGFDDSVNVTLGLPFVRTSPDHGTAFSLAGTGKAKPDSLIAALKLAAELGMRASGDR